MSDALMTAYKLVWNDFCSWYLEWIKPEYGQPIDTATYKKTIELLEEVLRLLHPFMPFITEELWHELKDRKDGEAIIVAAWPEASSFDENILKEADLLFEITSGVRNIRSSKGISPKEAFELTTNAHAVGGIAESLKKLANLSGIETGEKPANAFSFVVGSDEYFIPASENVDMEAEKSKMEEELKYAKGFKASVEKKLSNERFVNNAPAQVVEMERKKLADAEAKIKTLEESLAGI